ncbi:16892_t:CDS:2 [Cetraspora pellucida]|uniref:16892_t:CDS:1 n=1 Tax=Cetraspora pellucida TaxID=1433469 RepID=A0A9N9ANF4_9GLOM|nr:16892_t:CDS:2 [Cetraspora pellucida]
MSKSHKQPHELHDKYVHPSANHDPKLKMPIEKESIKQRIDHEIEAEDQEIMKKKDERQTKKIPAKK